MPSSVYRGEDTLLGMVHDGKCPDTGFEHDGPNETPGEAPMAGMPDSFRIVWTCRHRSVETGVELIEVR